MLGSKLGDSYQNVQPDGSAALRSLIRTKVFSGDAVIEKKLTAYQLYWKFYKNEHWAKNNDKLISINYVRAFIDKINGFLLGRKGFEFNIEDLFGEEVPEEQEKKFEALVNYLWRTNKKGVFSTMLFQMCGICGDAYVFLSPDTEKKSIKFTLLDSRNTVPIFKDGDYTQFIGIRVVQSLGSNEKDYVAKITEYTKEATKTYFVKDVDVKAEKFNVETSDNKLGYIPIVHFVNIPSSDIYGGISDVQDILKLNKIFNEMAEDVKAIVDYYAQPTTVVTGAVVGQLKRGINQIWSGLPADANVFNLSLNDDLPASQAFLTLLKNGMHETGGVPENVLGRTQFVSNTSAAALHILYHPLIDAADRKAVSYFDGIEDLNTMAVKMFSTYFPDHELLKGLPISEYYLSRYKAVPVFLYGLPNDRTIMINEAAIELSNKIGSRREVMERLGKRNIPKIMEEISEDEDVMAEKQIKTQIAIAQGSMPPQPAQPPQPPPKK